MTADLGIETLAAALARSVAFAATAPIAAAGAVPSTVRAVLALSLLPLLMSLQPPVREGHELIGDCVTNAAAGALFGTCASIVASAAVAAGGLIDGTLAAVAIGRESVFGGGAGPFGRFYALAFSAAFCATGALTNLCAAFVASGAPAVSLHAVVVLVEEAFHASIDLAAPSLASQIFASIVCGIAVRAAPRINGMMAASPVTTSVGLLTLLSGAYVTLRELAALAHMTAAAPIH